MGEEQFYSERGWPVTKDDGQRHDWVAIAAAEAKVAQELAAQGLRGKALWDEVTRRVKWEDYEVMKP